MAKQKPSTDGRRRTASCSRAGRVGGGVEGTHQGGVQNRDTTKTARQSGTRGLPPHISGDNLRDPLDGAANPCPSAVPHTSCVL